MNEYFYEEESVEDLINIYEEIEEDFTEETSEFSYYWFNDDEDVSDSELWNNIPTKFYPVTSGYHKAVDAKWNEDDEDVEVGYSSNYEDIRRAVDYVFRVLPEREFRGFVLEIINNLVKLKVKKVDKALQQLGYNCNDIYYISYLSVRRDATIKNPLGYAKILCHSMHQLRIKLDKMVETYKCCGYSDKDIYKNERYNLEITLMGLGLDAKMLIKSLERRKIFDKF